MATSPAIDMETEYQIGISSNQGNGPTYIESMFHVLNAATGTDTAVPWVSTLGWDYAIVTVDITTSGTLNIVGSNAATKPAASANGFALVSAITADGVANLTKDKLARWFKVYPSASGGAMTVDVMVRKIAMNPIV